MIKVDLIITASYELPDIQEQDAPELEMRFLQQELEHFIGPATRITMTFERNGKQEVLRG